MSKILDQKEFDTNRFSYYWRSVIFPTLHFTILKQPFKIFNVILAVVEKKLKRTKPRCKPFIFKIEAAAICNLKCPLCVQYKKELPIPDKKWITYDEYLVMHKQIHKTALRISFYIFGEALVNPHFIDILKKAYSDNIFTYFASNFNLATEEKIKELVHAGLGEVSVALDGWTQSQYEQYRVGGDINVVKHAIRYLMEYKQKNNLKWPLLKVNTIKFDNYKQDMDKIKNFCLEAKVDNYVIKPNLEHVPCNTGPKPYSQCFWLWYTMFIDTDGTVYPCLYQQRRKEFYYGNIMTDSLEDIWNSELYIKMRKFLVSKNKDQYSPQDVPCINCTLYN